MEHLIVDLIVDSDLGPRQTAEIVKYHLSLLGGVSVVEPVRFSVEQNLGIHYAPGVKVEYENVSTTD